MNQTDHMGPDSEFYLAVPKIAEDDTPTPATRSPTKKGPCKSNIGKRKPKRKTTQKPTRKKRKTMTSDEKKRFKKKEKKRYATMRLKDYNDNFQKWLERYDKFLNYFRKYQIFPKCSVIFEGEEIGLWYGIQQRMAMNKETFHWPRKEILRKIETPLEYMKRNRFRMGEPSNKPKLTIESMAEIVRREPNELFQYFDKFVKCMDDDYRNVVAIELFSAINKYRRQFHTITSEMIVLEQCDKTDIVEALRYLVEIPIEEEQEPVEYVYGILRTVYDASDLFPHKFPEIRSKIIKPDKSPLEKFRKIVYAKFICRMGMFFGHAVEMFRECVPKLNRLLFELKNDVFDTIPDIVELSCEGHESDD